MDLCREAMLLSLRAEAALEPKKQRVGLYLCILTAAARKMAAHKRENI